MVEIDLEQFKEIYQQEVFKQMRDNKVPGMSVLITQNGKDIYRRNFGSREWKDIKPATSDTIYGIASMTKSMTCTAILMLDEQGKLDIKDPISKYINVKLQFEDTPITIQHLMSHGSGLPNLGSYGVAIANENLTETNLKNFPMANWDDYYFHINDAQDWLLSKPGNKFYYCNDGFTLLSQIVSKVSGMKYEEYMTEHLLKPLGMDRSTFYRDELKSKDDVSKGYTTEFKKDKLNREPSSHLTGPFTSGAGGLNSTVNDLTKYLQFHLNNGKVGEKQLLSADLVKEMRKIHNNNDPTHNYLIADKKRGYGYGLAIYENFNDNTLVTHGGASGISGGLLYFIPELNITYVHLYNVGRVSSHMAYMAAMALTGKDPKDLPYYVRNEHYKELEGEYSAYKKYLEGKVIRKGGILYFEISWIEKVETPLIPVDDRELRPMKFYQYQPFGRMEVVFTFHQDGITTLEIERDVFKKVDYRPKLE